MSLALAKRRRRRYFTTIQSEFMGFNAFNTEDLTGSMTIDFLEYRRQLARLTPYDELAAKVMPNPKVG